MIILELYELSLDFIFSYFRRFLLPDGLECFEPLCAQHTPAVTVVEENRLSTGWRSLKYPAEVAVCECARLRLLAPLSLSTKFLTYEYEHTYTQDLYVNLFVQGSYISHAF